MAQRIVREDEERALRYMRAPRRGDNPCHAVTRVAVSRELLVYAGRVVPEGSGDEFIVETRWRRVALDAQWEAERHVLWEDLGEDLPAELRYRPIADAAPGRIF